MKLCKDCIEYSCGAQGSDGVSEYCGNNGTYFHHTESEDKRTRREE